MSRNQDTVTVSEHRKWFQNNKHKIYIAEVNGTPVGTCRIDTVSELSWTIAPEHRREGYGTEMVKQMVQKFDNPVACIKPENTASLKIAERAGMVREKLIVYRKGEK